MGRWLLPIPWMTILLTACSSKIVINTEDAGVATPDDAALGDAGTIDPGGPPSCSSSADCPSGTQCVPGGTSSVCQPTRQGTCAVNSDCVVPQICASDGQCRNQCLLQRDCVPGQLCNGGACY